MAWRDDAEQRVQKVADQIIMAADRTLHLQALRGQAMVESSMFGISMGSGNGLPDPVVTGRHFRELLVDILRNELGVTMDGETGPIRAISRPAPIAWALLEDPDPSPWAGIGGNELFVLHAMEHEDVEAAFVTHAPDYNAWRAQWRSGAYCGALRYQVGKLVERQRFLAPINTVIRGRREPWHVPMDSLREVRTAILNSRDRMARLMYGGR